MKEKTREKLLSRGKDRSRGEMEKLREMRFKQKLEYIWEYYKYQIIGGGVVLVILGSLLNTWIFNPSPNVGLFIAWDAGFIDQERLDSLIDTFDTQLTFETEDDVSEISLFFTDSADPQMAMAHTQRLLAMIAASAIDAFILDGDAFEQYAYIGYLVPMESLLSIVQSLNPAIYSRISEETAIALHSIDGEEFTERILGIRITDSPLLYEQGVIINGLHMQDLYFGIAVNSENPENVARALIMLFE